MEVEEALAAAAAADAAIASGDVCGPLHGVPLAHKDMYYITGRLAECGSKIRSGWVAPATSTVIARIQDAGAVRLGALHMAEFAYGPTGHNEHLGPARSPWDPQRITGGSSSGSAASVAARLTYAALGSDTGGSIRLPAHFCGVTGFKPTYGRVSRANAMPLSFTLDTVGPLALSAEDCALIGSVIAGADPLDPTTRGAPAWDMAATQRTPKGMTIGVPRKFYVDGLESDVATLLDEALATFRGLGARVVEVDLPDQTAISAAALIVLAVEATSLHAPGCASAPATTGRRCATDCRTGLLIARSNISRHCAGAGPRSQLISRQSTASTSSLRLLRALRRRPSTRPMWAAAPAQRPPSRRLRGSCDRSTISVSLCSKFRPDSRGTACRSDCNWSAGLSATRRRLPLAAPSKPRRTTTGASRIFHDADL